MATPKEAEEVELIKLSNMNQPKFYYDHKVL